MRKLLLCLTLAAVGLALETAQAQILRPFCSAYCCSTSSATSTSTCWINQQTTSTCGWYWANYSCP